MTLELAVDIVARQLVASEEEWDWEDYPEIGFYDWGRVVDRARELSPPPLREDYYAAYDFLTERGQQESGSGDGG